MSPPTTAGDTVHAKPVIMSRIGWSAAAFVLAVFLLVAAVMKRDNAGVHFGDKDQIATVVVGIILAGLFVMLTRPRMEADTEAVRLRSFLGGWRVVPWDVVIRVEFPSKVRFARLVLPGEETLAIYAVQRVDQQRAVETMRALRALHARVSGEK